MSNSKINTINRRNFIRTTGMAGAVLTIGYYFGCKGKEAKPTLAVIDELDMVSAKELSPFVMIDSKGTIGIIAHKPEMGQGTYQSMPMIVAEELGVTLDQVVIHMATVDKKYGDMSVGGSNSVRGSWTLLRKAGAAAREMLTTAAAKRWNVEAKDCKTEAGFVLHPSGGQKFSFGELVADASKLPVPQEPKLKDPSSFTLLGKPTQRPDIPLKVEGKAKFGIDTELPGMLYASVERCPVFGGKVKSFDDAAAKRIKGVKHVLVAERKSGKNIYYGVAVVADNYYAAAQGRKALNIEWDTNGLPLEDTASIYKRFHDLTKKDGVVVTNNGDFEDAYNKASQKIEAIYELPFAAHATMEPQNTVANVKAGGCEIWSPTQVPDSAVQTLKDYLQIPEEKIKLHFTLLGGGFGRRLFDDFITEAAYISKKVNAPVKVLWKREDDMTMGPFRPGTLSSFRGGINEAGSVVALQHKVVAPSIMYNQFGGTDKNHKEDGGAVEGIKDTWYDIPNVLTNNVYAEVNVPLGWWRSVYSSTVAFAHECFIDELAHAAKKDPLDFRLAMVNKNKRMKNLLLHLREKGEWDKPLPQGWGKGVAVWQFFAGQAGHIVYVSKQNEGGIKIEKVVAVIDCGFAVNPDNVKAQVEGATIMAFTAATKDEITFSGGQAMQKNFDTYQMIRMNQAPRVEVYIYPSNEEPGGVGEPGIPPAAPALANAIFAATGTRIRKLPFDLNKV